MMIGSQIPSKRVCMKSLKVETEWEGTVPPAVRRSEACEQGE
ncbi:hypothetical protein BDI4_900016 [Burkholderia diffusa]|nr:hypothetical protein BDI4_900016 [Burkholderia diffusa]